MPQLVGKEVGPIGFGLMGFTWRANPCSKEQAFETMRAALDNGMNFWNGGEFYGTPEYNSLTLLAEYFEKYPADADKVILSIKGAVGNGGTAPDGSPEGVRRSVDNCLKLLKGRKTIDIFECARRDQNVPLEVTFGVLDKEYVQTSKIGGISLSEVKASTIHEAAKITKIVACEVELSLFSTDVLNNGVAAACAEHNIPLIAYSPIGRGMLSGQIKTLDDIPADSHLRHFPRFQPDTFSINMQLVKQIDDIAEKKGCTPAQLVINWTKTVGKKSGMPTIIPIPGATTAARVNENAKSVQISNAEMAEIDSTLQKFEVVGARYPTYVPTEG
ncbi:aldo/keto reductase [Pseudomassariella vexata]|uniref:Aldo/keto reductase n=1 Tax=Pseudomassariella vexata TaxID=1141098 RepID=A0A1Y2DFQ6_9PEZI|nr:aldo/keto reductase [Pseudomassariella vexata]ORY57525.1 aldo/keto reductase [Pseudomassariella vexata]